MKTPSLFFAISVRISQTFSELAVGTLLLLVVLVGGALPAHGQYTNVWSDEFDGTNVDLTKWTFEVGNGNTPPNTNPSWGNNELEYYTGRTNNMYVTNGMLHVRAQIEVTNSTEGTFRYTSARMKTQGLFNKQYGRIEWRAKLPAGTGMWPAIWALGSSNIGWPAEGEIDVVENNGANPNFVQGSLHWSGGDSTGVFTNFTGGDSVTNFHVYDLDWTNNSIKWSVDGVVYQTQAAANTFNAPFYFLINLAVGGTYVGNPSTNSINPSMPGELVIDYMRVFDYVTTPQTNLPAIPMGLTATPGAGQIGLNWNTAAFATSYTVWRSTVSGGPYNSIAAPTATTYTDTGLAGCSTYYYVVSSGNSVGVSSNSTEASATLGPFYYAVNSGGNAAGTFLADTNVVGGTVAAPTATAIITTGLTNPAPQAVYQSERYGNFKYTFGGLATGSTYTVRLHLCEYYFNAANSRKFNVFINNTQVLTNLDIFAAAGGQFKALIREYAVAPNGSGQISVTYSNGTLDQAKSSGIELLLPAPVTPSGLIASASAGQVSLNWNAVSGATGYNVKRSTVSGNSYGNVASGIASTNFTDTGVTNGTTYYYVVSTLKSSCESTNSTEVNATPTAPLSPFQQWQTLYFGSTTNPAAAATFDADGTGQNNLFKYVAGLDPTNPASVFVVNVTSTVAQPTEASLMFTPWAVGRGYLPQFSTDLVSGVWFPLSSYTGPTTNGNQITITDTGATDPQMFYRIDISLP